MRPAPFGYVRPHTLEEALATLAARGGEAKVLAGGQSLVPLLKCRLARPALLVDVGRLEELKGARRADGHIVLGAATTYAELARSDLWPFLGRAALEVGTPQVRNRGTVGGSLAHADPAADFPAVALAARAELILESRAGRRSVPAEAFFHGPFRTGLEEGELLVAVRLPAPEAHTTALYRKVRHPASGYAVVGVAAVIERDEAGRVRQASFGVTGVAPQPYRARGAETAPAGVALTPKAIRAAARIVEGVEVVGDLYAGAAYRAHLARVVAGRMLAEVAEGQEASFS